MNHTNGKTKGNSDTKYNFNPSSMSNQQLFDYMKQLILSNTSAGTPELTATLALMVTGLFLSQHVQLHSIAIFFALGD